MTSLPTLFLILSMFHHLCAWIKRWVTQHLTASAEGTTLSPLEGRGCRSQRSPQVFSLAPLSGWEIFFLISYDKHPLEWKFEGGGGSEARLPSVGGRGAEGGYFLELNILILSTGESTPMLGFRDSFPPCFTWFKETCFPLLVWIGLKSLLVTLRLTEGSRSTSSPVSFCLTRLVSRLDRNKNARGLGWALLMNLHLRFPFFS